MKTEFSFAAKNGDQSNLAKRLGERLNVWVFFVQSYFLLEKKTNASRLIKDFLDRKRQGMCT